MTMRDDDHPPRFSMALTIGCCLLASSAGCSDGRVKTYPAAGQVLVDGKPAGGAVVVFCPVPNSREIEQLRPWGKTDSTGLFRLATFVRGDGAPQGTYQVTVQWPKTIGRQGKPSTANRDDDRGGSDQRDVLKGRYARPDKSGLTAVIKRGNNELSPIELDLPR
jgi:hypothetical protein